MARRKTVPEADAIVAETNALVNEAVELMPEAISAVTEPTVEEVAAEPEAVESETVNQVVLAAAAAPSGSVARRLEPATVVELRAIRKVIDTLVFGCDSQRTRQEAAAPAVEILDRLIGE